MIAAALINRYDGAHVDNTLRAVANQGALRTDISATLFLADPASYGGGELVIEDTFGAHAIKLPAGDMILYPSGALRHVRPVTRGVRFAACFWMESYLRDDADRDLLFRLEGVMQELHRENPQQATLPALGMIYQNLLRRWAET